MIAGPNGSGKSTLFDWLRLQPWASGYLSHYLNPDVLAADFGQYGSFDLGTLYPHVEETTLRNFISARAQERGYSPPAFWIVGEVLHAAKSADYSALAAIICDFVREEWLARRRTFAFETVMAHESKVTLMRNALDAGYRTYLYYICTESPLINRERIGVRVAQGGHDVPSDRIFSRYARSLALLPRAVGCSTRAYLFDNSSQTHGHRLIAEYESGALVSAVKHVPAWFIEHVLNAPKTTHAT